MPKGRFHPVNRREFVKCCAQSLSAAVLARRLSWGLSAMTSSGTPVRLGTGNHTYEWVRGWAKLPDGMRFGNTHGAVIVDSQGRVLMNTDTENAIIVFDPDGKFIRAFGKEWKDGLHGMALHKEAGGEFIYVTHHTRHEFAKLSLDGTVMWVKGFPVESELYEKADDFRPTGIAIAPNGDLYITDGYGLSWVHHYSSAGEYLKSWGGPAGSEPGKLRQPHGIWMDTRGPAPLVLIADRANHRLQWFNLNGEFVKAVTDDLRLPSNFDQRGSDLVIADLAGRVTILDGINRVITHLGDNPDPGQRGQNPIPPERWVEGIFISPHCPRWDAEGNLYVTEWLSNGRIDKLKRV